MQLDLGEEVTVKKVSDIYIFAAHQQHMDKVVTRKGVKSTSPCKKGSPPQDGFPILVEYLALLNLSYQLAVGHKF